VVPALSSHRMVLAKSTWRKPPPHHIEGVMSLEPSGPVHFGVTKYPLEVVLAQLLPQLKHKLRGRASHVGGDAARTSGKQGAGMQDEVWRGGESV
jgi:hypothetical protein